MDGAFDVAGRGAKVVADDLGDQGGVTKKTYNRLAELRKGYGLSDIGARVRLRAIGNIVGTAQEVGGKVLKAGSRALGILGAAITVQSAVSDEIAAGPGQGRSELESVVRGIGRGAVGVGFGAAGGAVGFGVGGAVTGGMGGEFVGLFAGAAVGVRSATMYSDLCSVIDETGEATMRSET